jgi:hypothetical protein
VWVFGFRERETVTAKKGMENLLPLPLRVHRKKVANNAIKTASFASFFKKQCMKRCRFEQNVLFHLNENGAKEVSNSKSILNFLFI